jgi:K+-transporting ATPase ATPase B chain
METRTRDQKSNLLDPAILGPAAGQALKKLDPRLMIRNPVMFVVEVVATLTTVIFLRDLFTGGAHIGFTFQIILWLWITVLFANFAEAVAEGRGKAQAASLRRARTDTMANRLTAAGTTETVPAPELKQNDIVLVAAGELIPSDER